MALTIIDGFVKRLDAALRFILPRLSPGQACGVRNSTPHSSGFARLACGLFTKPSHFHDFFDFLRGCRHPLLTYRG
jgi:hypothetical protein